MPELYDQLEQFNKIMLSYRSDMKTLNKILDSWQPDKTTVDDLAEQIKSSVKNSAEITIKANELNQYLIEFIFRPIMVSLVIDKK